MRSLSLDLSISFGHYFVCAVQVMKKGGNLILCHVHQCFSPPLTSSTVSRVFLSVPPPPPLTLPLTHRVTPRVAGATGAISALSTPPPIFLSQGAWPGSRGPSLTRSARERHAPRGGEKGRGSTLLHSGQPRVVVFCFVFSLLFFPARDTNTALWLINRFILFGFATANKCVFFLSCLV